ncbi:glycoside hydrolase domain-containing protein [Nocardioides limicola]|uniref:glycoside hydrolase domain-containing protein n=1 Tax=Nocardioides limicola TaxID=2803368 RepID=UPI00193B3F13|nr:glycoside hydrolase domain-containing protein [Nocardioides sp. DJM-14]
MSIRRTVATAAAAALLAALTIAAPAQASNRATPGDFTGYGFDQCLAPTQKAMDTWLHHSPFWAVGIYITGDSRGCRNQPNLTPTWISTQLANGWRLLPITLGPQAGCSPHFPRYGNDPVISRRVGDGTYPRARAQAVAEADKAVTEALRLGIVAGSTLWYDIEAFDITKVRCRESVLWFLSAWTERLHQRGYVSGVYSSAGSGIKALDDARVNRPGTFTLPDRIWLARWDGIANTSSSFIREDGWRPGGRVKQYLGGHLETWGGVTINIDSNWLDLGRGSSPRPKSRLCGTKVDFAVYRKVGPANARPAQTKALKCLLKRQGFYQGKVNDRYTDNLRRAIRAFRAAHPGKVAATFNRRNWVQLHARGGQPVLKVGSTGPAVRRVQRAMNAAGGPKLAITGAFDRATETAVKEYQRKVGVTASGVISLDRWQVLTEGRR